MEIKNRYHCKICDSRLDITENEGQSPECCGQPMRLEDETEVCLKAADPEHVRLQDSDMPCDDSRSG